MESLKASEEFFGLHVFITIMLLIIIIIACNESRRLSKEVNVLVERLSDKVDLLSAKIELLEYKLELQGG